MSATTWLFGNLSHTVMLDADCMYACGLDEAFSHHNAMLLNDTIGNAPTPLLINGRPKWGFRNFTNKTFANWRTSTILSPIWSLELRQHFRWNFAIGECLIGESLIGEHTATPKMRSKQHKRMNHSKW
ncbi:unnamed protein product [Rotaria socialis]|uniref:Uncharacterized protein n=1 Tax=Rotaria socialis TaxID=392032 RepID=A0A817UB18_9BILA|nr:unnamed protein product [Rotaria socialis]